MQRDATGLLWDAHEAAAAIAQFLAGCDENAYLADRLLRSGVERQCEIIGEALNRFSRIAPELAARIPELSKAVAFRNLLIHGYATVDDGLVWRTATTDIPILRERLAALLAEITNPWKS